MSDNTTLSKELTRTESILTDKIKHLEGLSHMIAHNLQGSAANINMFAEILINKNISDEGHDETDDNVFTVSESIQYIHESSVSLLHTLATIMELSEIQLNENIKYDECDITEIMKHIVNQLSGLIQQNQVTIEEHFDANLINYPMPYMESILYNIINNAIKYSRADIPVKIVISTYKQEGAVILSVKDNGVGIDLKKYGRRIFNLYQVFHHGYESKGIGLYIIKKQIESMGGTITVKSEVDKGSEFTVTFKTTHSH